MGLPPPSCSPPSPSGAHRRFSDRSAAGSASTSSRAGRRRGSWATCSVHYVVIPAEPGDLQIGTGRPPTSATANPITASPATGASRAGGPGDCWAARPAHRGTQLVEPAPELPQVGPARHRPTLFAQPFTSVAYCKRGVW